MQRICLTLFITVIYCSALPAQTGNPRQQIPFDKEWKFHLGNAADPAKDFNFGIRNIFVKSGNAKGTAIDAQFRDSAWRTVQLPHDWAVELPFENADNEDVRNHGYRPVGGLYPQNSIGWYRKHFKVPAADSGKRFSVQFDGIYRDSYIWINGLYLGHILSGYIGKEFDITDFVNFQQDNVLVVRVDASQYEGWYYEGAGIYRHVWLNEYGNLHIIPDGIYAYANIKDKESLIHIEASIRNQQADSVHFSLSSGINDREGKALARTKEEYFSLAPDETKTFKQEIRLSNPRLWSIQDPYLYRINTEIRSGNKIRDDKELKFGIREIRIDSSGLYINGVYTKVLGVNCHPDHAGLGMALPDHLQYYRIQKLKEMGANAYRTSHNPPTPELLEACDSLGMIVLDENRMVNSSPEYRNQFARLICRDRNHPSVFLWSIGNEEGYIQTRSSGKRIARSLLALQQRLDPQRLSTYGADLGNIYPGINEVVPVRGFNYRIAAIDDYHREHPGQPILGTEMGSTVTTRGIYRKDTVRAYLPDEDLNAPWWANTAGEWWPMAAERSWWMGGFVWTGFDYRGEPTPFEWPNINSHFGVMDICGFPKNLYYYYKSWWSDEDVLHISPHWNWKGQEGKPMDVWVNSNAETVELFLNGRSLGRKTMPVNKHLQWKVPYAEGILKAVAFRHGRKLTAQVETTGPPYRLLAVPDKTILLADGKDAAVINLSVLDAQGREVPDANNLIHFSVSGNIHIIGVGNGDPSSHEPDKCMGAAWQRSSFNGKCQVIVQSAGKPGSVEFAASANGLQTGKIKLQLVDHL
jgi:beta-galactosidase